MRIAPPPIRTMAVDNRGDMTREWQKWFIDLVKAIQATQLLVYEQDDEPTIPSGYYFALWKDTNDSDKCYLIYKRCDSDQLKVELT